VVHVTASEHHLEATDRPIYVQSVYPPHIAPASISVFVLSDDDLVTAGLTAKSLRDLFETALQVSVRSPDQQEAIEFTGIVLDRLA
jgi:hypothetical protein